MLIYVTRLLFLEYLPITFIPPFLYITHKLVNEYNDQDINALKTALGV